MAQDMESKISYLEGMGFDRAQILKALRAKNNDVSLAIEYILGGQDDSNYNMPPEDININETTLIENSFPPSLQNSISSNAAPLANENNDAQLAPPTFDVNMDEAEISLSDTPRYSQQDETSEQATGSSRASFEVSCLPEHIESSSMLLSPESWFREPSDPPVLLPNKQISQLSALLLILHGIPAVRAQVFKLHQFKDYGFSPNWWRGFPQDLIHLKPEDSRLILHSLSGEPISNLTIDGTFLIELQRLFAFLDGGSGRAFSTVIGLLNGFAHSRENSIVKLPSENSETLVGVHSFVESVIQLTGGLSSPLLDTFTSVASSATGGLEDRIHVFPIEAEDKKSTLMETLDEMIWSSGLGEAFLKHVADVVRFSLSSEDNRGVSLLIPGAFYPQRYTEKFIPVIRKLRKLQEEFELKRQSLYKQLMALSTIKGKDAIKSLNQTLSFLKKTVAEKQKQESELTEMEKEQLAATIAAQEDMERVITEAVNRKTELKDQLMEWDRRKYLLRSVDVDDPSVEEVLPEPLEEYVLAGIAFGDRRLIYRRPKTKEDSFVLVDMGEEGITNSTGQTEEPEDWEDQFQWWEVYYDDSETSPYYDIREQSLEYAIEAVARETHLTYHDEILIVYAKKSAYSLERLTDLPPGLKEFIRRDKEELENAKVPVNTEPPVAISSEDQDTPQGFSFI